LSELGPNTIIYLKEERLFIFMEGLKEKVGERVINMLNSNPKISSLIEKLGEVCDKQGERHKDYKNGWPREMIFEWAYAGTVLSALHGKDNVERLKRYVKNIEYRLGKNEYSDPPFYVKECFNDAFK
jgi:hypothetical protein